MPPVGRSRTRPGIRRPGAPDARHAARPRRRRAPAAVPPPTGRPRDPDDAGPRSTPAERSAGGFPARYRWATPGWSVLFVRFIIRGTGLVGLSHLVDLLRGPLAPSLRAARRSAALARLGASASR